MAKHVLTDERCVAEEEDARGLHHGTCQRCSACGSFIEMTRGVNGLVPVAQQRECPGPAPTPEPAQEAERCRIPVEVPVPDSLMGLRELRPYRLPTDHDGDASRLTDAHAASNAEG